MTVGVPVDGHVHLYPCCDLDGALDAARRNLDAAARRAGLPSDGPRAILLTETATEGALARLVTRSGGPWRTDRPEETALVLHWPDGPPLAVIAGRQFQTAERIEVLAIGTTLTGHDGLQLAELLDKLADHGTPAILPWGVGKWLGSRGRIVASTAAARPGLLLGDNAGRPVGWPAPDLFSQHIVLPGTDPLPYRGAEAGIGRFGFWLPGALDLSCPATDLCRKLSALDRSPRHIGRRTGPLRAVADQVRLRLGK